MRFVPHTDGLSLLRAAGTLLVQAEAENCYLLGTCAAPRTGATGPGRLFLVLEEEGAPVGVAVQVPPGPLGLSRLPESALAPLVQWLRAQGLNPAHVAGPRETVERFAAAWTAASGATAVTVMRQGVYELTQVRPPARPAVGSLREAEQGDAPLLADWAETFAQETGLPAAEQASMRRASAGWLVDRLVWLWEAEGAPVSMAVAQGPTPTGIRVGMVYTPPAQRGRGYASALVAALSQHQLDAGRRACFLFTNLANPTSNGIYQQVGYVQVSESLLMRLEAAPR